MLKKLFTLVTVMLLGSGLQAQSIPTSNEVIEGANGAKMTILRKAMFCSPDFLSEDARYICGMYGTESGYVYDLEKDTCILFPDYGLTGYVSPDHYVGGWFTHYNGISYPFRNGEGAQDGGASVFAVQGNCDKIVTMIYETYTTASGLVKHMNRAAIHDGKTGQQLMALPYAWPVPTDDEDKLRFGSRGDCISGDGAIVGGHSTNLKARSNWSLAFWDISDPNDIKTFGFGSEYGLSDRAFGFGSLYGANYDGSLIVGGSRSNDKGVIVHYNRGQKKIDRVDTITPLPSWDLLDFSAVSDDGMVIGCCGMEFDPFTREAAVYTELTGLIKLSDFLYEYYDIDVRKGVDLYTPLRISRDGRRILGFFYEDEYPMSYILDLSETRILPRARKISARAGRGVEEAYITWQEPLVSEYTLTGYNIYRDDEEKPLNTTVLPVSTTTYADHTVKSGKHTYYVEAVYTDGSAMKQVSNQIQVVGQGVAFPVQTIDHRVDYNRFAHIYWGVPSSEVVALAKNDIVTPDKEVKGRFEHAVEPSETAEAAIAETASAVPLRSKSYFSTTLDYIANVDMLTYSGRAAVKIGDYYYTSSHMGGGIKVIDRFNEVVKTIHPDNLGIVVSMVYLEDENLLYCGTSKGLINVLDLNTEDIVSTYDIQATHLAYVPDMKDGKPGLVAGGPHSCNTYLWDEEEKDYKLEREDYLDFKPLYAMGSVYYKGRLYVSSATGPYLNEVHVYNFNTKQRFGDPVQVVEDPALYNLLTDNGNALLVANLASSTMAGGLSVCQLDDGTTALGMVFQLAYFTARFMLLELESAETVEGYNLYRSVDGGTYDKVNDAPMTSRRYTEVLEKAGRYTYYVVVKSANNADDSEKSPVDTLTISEPDTCPQPDFTVKESNRWPVLTWMPGNSGQYIVGFDLYRDDAHIARLWNNDMRLEYIDDAVTGLGTHNYRLEALYEDGCVAAAAASVTLTGEGDAKEPFGLTYAEGVNNNGTYKVTLTWETPMFEDPLPLKYCNGLQGESIGFDNFYECWGLIGWRKSDLDPYRDLYLVGMEYMVGDVPDLYEAIVIIDNEQVYEQKVKQLTPRVWRTVWFNQSFRMDQEEEVAVGFHTKYSAESMGVLGVDPTVTVNGKSNILSLDGYRWSTLQAGGLSGSWLLGALVVHKRELEAAMNADGSINHTKLAGHVMHMALDGQASAKAPLQLLGFNVYRTNLEGAEVKLNDAPLTTFSWTDSEVAAEDDYDYDVAALYADGKEVRASVFVSFRRLDEGGTEDNEDQCKALNLNVYPNPASGWINVEGAYETLQIFDFGGRLLRTQPAAHQIQIGDLTPGTYMLHFTGADARKAVYKIVVR